MNEKETQFTNTSPLQLPEEENGKPVEVVVVKKIKVNYFHIQKTTTERYKKLIYSQWEIALNIVLWLRAKPRLT